MLSQGESLHLGLRDDVELQLVIHQTGPGFREVALVQDQAVAAEATRTAKLLQPLGPLGVELTIRLLVLGFKHTDNFLQRRNETQIKSFRFQREREEES